MRQLSVIGVPSSAGSYAAGQDQAPAALRHAGLIQALNEAGLLVRDHGDLPEQIWRPDRQRPFAQNVGQVTACLQELADRLGPLLADGDTILVLGGNCTIALAVIAGLQRLDAGPPGLLYVDRHFDLNTPDSTTDGALDWMGLAHGFALPGTVDALTEAFGHRPLLQPTQVAWLGVDASCATAWEREQADRLGLHVTSSTVLADDPRNSAAGGLGVLPSGPLAVHIDVDVLDFIDAPLAENTDSRNTGPTLDQLAQALLPAAGDPRLRALSIGELNPTRSAGEPDAIPRFIRMLAATLSPPGGQLPSPLFLTRLTRGGCVFSARSNRDQLGSSGDFQHPCHRRARRRQYQRATSRRQYGAYPQEHPDPGRRHERHVGQIDHQAPRLLPER